MYAAFGGVPHGERCGHFQALFDAFDGMRAEAPSPIDSVLPHFRHTLWWMCGGVWSRCGQRTSSSSHTWPAPWLQGPATKLWHHILTTKPATFRVGLWCKCGVCVGQLCGWCVVGLGACTPPHPPHTIATPAPPHSSCSRPPTFYV